jgi:predicted pyridoxine 5'-phosphate oxidase superfamily flavin-nucleotide-binding protein
MKVALQLGGTRLPWSVFRHGDSDWMRKIPPGANETYRVNGRARISVDADLRRRFAVNGKEPATVMVVMVEQTFPHCPKALVRSDLWKAASSGRPQGVATLGDFVAARNPETNSAAFDAHSQRALLIACRRGAALRIPR